MMSEYMSITSGLLDSLKSYTLETICLLDALMHPEGFPSVVKDCNRQV